MKLGRRRRGVVMCWTLLRRREERLSFCARLTRERGGVTETVLLWGKESLELQQKGGAETH